MHTQDEMQRMRPPSNHPYVIMQCEESHYRSETVGLSSEVRFDRKLIGSHEDGTAEKGDKVL